MNPASQPADETFLRHALALSVITCTVTMALMIFMLPTGIADGILSCTALILLLTQYFGACKITE